MQTHLLLYFVILYYIKDLVTLKTGVSNSAENSVLPSSQEYITNMLKYKTDNLLR